MWIDTELKPVGRLDVRRSVLLIAAQLCPNYLVTDVMTCLDLSLPQAEEPGVHAGQGICQEPRLHCQEHRGVYRHCSRQGDPVIQLKTELVLLLLLCHARVESSWTLRYLLDL